MNRTADVVICGAGITGIAAAHFLSQAGLRDILLIDERPPLSLTSDKSTECYRNWWPDADMLSLMNRSIDLMEALADEGGNAFHLNRRGYLYVVSDEEKVTGLRADSLRTSSLGAVTCVFTPMRAPPTFRRARKDFMMRRMARICCSGIRSFGSTFPI